jgi:hypothetical protein
MKTSTPVGLVLTLIAGAMSGNCMLPTKFVRTWKWENVWAIFSVVSLILLPWALALALVKDLEDVYRTLTFAQIAVPLALGAGWGVAQVLFGISVKRLGLGVAYAIICGPWRRARNACSTFCWAEQFAESILFAHHPGGSTPDDPWHCPHSLEWTLTRAKHRRQQLLFPRHRLSGCDPDSGAVRLHGTYVELFLRLWTGHRASSLALRKYSAPCGLCCLAYWVDRWLYFQRRLLHLSPVTEPKLVHV